MTIPKIIHQVWIGPKEPPIKPMDTWKDKHPDFEYIRWNELELKKRDMKFECLDKIDSMEQYCGKVDIMRLELLYKYGGVFLDADSICIEPIDDLLDNNFMIYENEKVRKGLIANGIMGFVPNHPFIKKCIDFIKNNEVSQSKTGLLPWQITGPTLVTKIYDKDIFNDIQILPSYTFLPIHNTGIEYKGHGKVYSHQLWGSTNFGKFDMSGIIPKQFLKPENEVSILIPSYNTNIRYVNECLMSIKKQVGHIGIEIVWIDDGSDELNSTLLKKALEEFEKTTRFVRMTYSENEENKGLGYSLNKGVELCTNQIIFRMDSDDIMIPTRIQKQLEFMNNNPECVLCGTQVKMFRNIDNKFVDCGKTNHPNLDLETFKKNSSNHWLMNHPTFCFRKRQIIEVGNYNDSIHSMCEDFELILRVLKKYGKIYNIQDILLYYRLHENQLTYNGGKEGSVHWTKKRNQLIEEILYKNVSNITPKRFDLMAKYLYIKSYDKKYTTKFFKELYHKHLITFNNCYELPDITMKDCIKKENIEDYINNFDKLIDDIKKNGYNETYPIPIGYNNVIINGAHRLMTSYYYNINPITEKINKIGCESYNFDFFKNRKENPSLDDVYSDTMALEYIKHNRNIRSMIIYPISNMNQELINIINQYGYIYYCKSVELNKNGVRNLIKEAYRGESWIGGMFPSDYSANEKTELCFDDNNTTILLIEMNDVNKSIELKEKCRKLLNLGKHSLHMSDYTKDTFRISSVLLNKNSIDYLNNDSNDISDNTKNLLIKYFDKLDGNNEDYCLKNNIFDEITSLENMDDHEVIYNPNNYYYINGFKIQMIQKYDIIIPSCKKDQFILQKTIQSIKKYIKDYRRIIVVSDEKLTDHEGVEWFDEKQYPFNKKDIYNCLYKIESDEMRRRKVGYINQLIKLYAHKVIPDLLENILICDSDIVFIKETTFFEKNKPLYSNRLVNKDEYQPYLNHMLKLNPNFDFYNIININKQLKKDNKYYSGICHHQIFNKYVIDEIIKNIEDYSNNLFWKVFLESTDLLNKNILKQYEPSEYELYYNYVNLYHPDKIKIRKITWLEMPAQNRQKNQVIDNYELCFDNIKKYALQNDHHYIAFHSYNRELFY